VKILAALLATFLACAAARAQTQSTALVVQDRVPLRAAARDSAQQQAVLWQGDALEIRGSRADYFQVYDHRRERAGFVRATQVRVITLAPEQASDLLAIVRFLRDTPGSEALGIGYVAAYLKAAPAEAIGADPFDALGTMADRLARRASANTDKTRGEIIAAHLEVVASYGVAIQSFEREERMQLCYDGDAFRRVLALGASDVEKARAALGVTRPECVDPALTPHDRADLDTWRAEVLDRVPRANLPEYVKNRLRIRSAAVWSSIAFERARRGEVAIDAAERALHELAGVDKRELAESDVAAYDDAAMRVGASRWAAEPVRAQATSGLAVVTSPGQPGETCIALVDKKHGAAAPLIRRCTFGIVWPASANANASGSALALAVQPLDGWREMWIFRRGNDGWRIDTAPPAADASELGYIEFAGWVPGGRKILAAREARIAGRLVKRFEILDLDTLAVEKHADAPASLSLFYRWQDAAWKRQTVSLR